MINPFSKSTHPLQKKKQFSHLKYSSIDFNIPHFTTTTKPKKNCNTLSRINRFNSPNPASKTSNHNPNTSSFSSEKPVNQTTTNKHPHNQLTQNIKSKKNINTTYLNLEPTALIHKFYYLTDKTHIKPKAKKPRQNNITNHNHSKTYTNNNMNINNNNIKTESTSISTTSIKPVISSFISLRNCNSVKKTCVKSRNNTNTNCKNTNNVQVNNINKNSNNNSNSIIKKNICENSNHSNLINNNGLRTPSTISSFEAIQIELDRAMKSQSNKTKNKKYSVLKKALESILEYCSENHYDNGLITLLEKIISIVHHIYTKFTNETNHLKEINDDYIKQIDKLKNEHEEKQQSLILMYSNEIQSLQKKIELLSRHTTTSEPVSEYSPKYNYNNKDKMYSTINNSKIESINKENLSDLDALYFFDKVQMGGMNSCTIIPTLPLAISRTSISIASDKNDISNSSISDKVVHSHTNNVETVKKHKNLELMNLEYLNSKV